MTIETWPIDRPKNYPQNPRKWSAQAVGKVAASIREFGWRQPVVVDKEGVIVIGHLRRAAGKSIGLKECPVHIASDLTPAQIRALRLADNRTNEEAAWDVELLGPELLALKDLDVDLSLTGFDIGEIDSLLADPEDDERANACGDLPLAPVSRPGDMWRCGLHRVLCGDSTAESAVSRLFAGQKRPFLMITDPPYGVEYDPEWRVAGGLQHRARQAGKVTSDDRVDWSPAWALFPGDVAYVWHAGLYAADVSASLLLAHFVVRSQIIWRKQRFVISRGAYHWGHEPCWYAVREGKSAHWNGDRTQSTVWDVDNLVTANRSSDEDDPQNAISGHGTQKPVELMRRPILNHTHRGETVYDPFLGSGTTLIAAEVSERICYGIEIDPRYVDVIVERWQQFTGGKATLDGVGATFEHVRDGRRLGAADELMEEALGAE